MLSGIFFIDHVIYLILEQEYYLLTASPERLLHCSSSA